MLASYRDEGREPPIGAGHVEPHRPRDLKRRDLERYLRDCGCQPIREGANTPLGQPAA